MWLQQNVVQVVVPAGRYFLGDPCYAVPDAFWEHFGASNDWWQKGPIAEYNGMKVLGFGTAFGDGEYLGTNGHHYPVDSGMIGLVPEKLALMALGKLGKESVDHLGSWIEFQMNTLCSVDDGVMTFGSVTINTKEQDEDYYDDDGQPDEAQEWTDYDADC